MGVLAIVMGIGFFAMFVFMFDGMSKAFGNRGRAIKRQHKAQFRTVNHRQTPATKAIARHRAERLAAEAATRDRMAAELARTLAEIQSDIKTLQAQDAALTTVRNAWATTVRQFS